MIQLLYPVFVLLALIPSVGYVARYAYLTKGAWRMHVVGKALMYKAIVNSLLLGFIGFNLLYRQIFGTDYAARPYIGFALFVAFTVVLWRLWLAFEKSQKPNKERKDR